MGLAVVFRLLGLAIIGLGFAMALPLAAALAAEPARAGDYVFGMAFAIAGGGGLAAIGARPRESDLRGAILTVLLWWVVAPVFAGAPFAIAGAAPVDAYFEAASALTTTGAWLSNDAAVASPSGALWRATMQWLGGLVSLAVAAAIFVRPLFVGIDTLLPPFARGERESDLRAVVAAIRSFSVVYAVATVVCWFTLAFAGSSPFAALIAAMSVVASGGFVANADGAAGLAPETATALAPFVFLSGANFILLSRILTGRRRRLQDAETGAYAMIVLGLAVALCAFAAPTVGTLIAEAPAQVFNAASLMSTNGLILGTPPPLALALVAVIIGGSAVSTAGGLKILRWLVIFRRAREEVRRLVSPNAAFGRASVVNELGVWMHFLMLTVTIGVLTLILTGGGYSFELAASAAVALLANAGPVLALAEGGADGYGAFEHPILRFAMVIGMILGRLEAVTALALLNRSFWRS